MTDPAATHNVLPCGKVFVLARAAEEQAAVASAVRATQPNLSVISLTSAHDAIAAWEREKGVVPAERAPAFTFSCLVAVGASDTDGAVVYALHCRKTPVLLLTRSPPPPPANGGSSNDAAASAAPPHTHPLLDSRVLAAPSVEAITSAVADYLALPARRGRVVVIEGGDGAGKQTQTALLLKRLRDAGMRAETLDFPHDAARYGVLIREALAGHKGELRDVSPLVFASLYGLNRHDLKPWIDNWLLRGTHVVFDRWTTANYGHQASKFASDAERDAAIAALQAFEVRWLGLPEADRVLYLDLPPAAAHAAMLADSTRRELDLHEKAGIEYKDNVRRAFLWCCGRFAKTWTHVPCWDDKAGARISRDGVHAAIWAACEALFATQ
jgi:dTMP kinase